MLLCSSACTTAAPRTCAFMPAPAEGDGFRRFLLASQYKTVLSLSRLS